MVPQDKLAHIAAALGGAKATGEVFRDCWRTPLTLFNPLTLEFGFTLDVAASADMATHLAPSNYALEAGQNGLQLPWSGVAYCNPPFSQMATWVAKARTEILHNATATVILCPARTETAWFRLATSPLDAPKLSSATTGRLGPYSWVGWRTMGQDFWLEVRLLAPRVRYISPTGTPAGSPTYGSCLIIYGHLDRWLAAQAF